MATVKDENKKIQQLESQLEDMKKLLSDLINKEKKEKANKEIPMTKFIKVMSLYNGGLNLKTAKQNGKEFRFTKVGQIIPIMFQDLVMSFSIQRKFYEEGYCMVLDEEFVEMNYLEPFYKKFIDADTIYNILNLPIEEVETIFSNVTSVIKQTIVDVIIEKINNDESIDRNAVNIIGKIYGKDIFDLANKIK
jgi:hypothetical protein